MRSSTCDVNGGLRERSVGTRPFQTLLLHSSLCYQEEMPAGPNCSHILDETMHVSEKAAMDIPASADTMGSKDKLPLLSPIQSTNS